jgi:hypothetical protein
MRKYNATLKAPRLLAPYYVHIRDISDSENICTNIRLHVHTPVIKSLEIYHAKIKSHLHENKHLIELNIFQNESIIKSKEM